MSQAENKRTQAALPTVDGRTARGRRTREAVVEAVIALLNEGDVRPTAARVAERAGVSLRSVFQHFADLEDLFATVADRQFAVFQGIPALPEATEPLEQRIEGFIERRTLVLERITPVRRAAVLQAPFSAVVRERLDRVRRAGIGEVERVFATELSALREPLRAELVAALHASTAWTNWENLRAEQGLSVDDARRSYGRILRALLNEVAALAADAAEPESAEA
jgi:TetR/AcrR family transcriptional regulator, regulator of autoinduction and epiphytic fitness